MAEDWSKMTDAELQEAGRRRLDVQALPEGEREFLQVELARRNRWQYIRPDGSIGHQPDDWKGS